MVPVFPQLIPSLPVRSQSPPLWSQTLPVYPSCPDQSHSHSQALPVTSAWFTCPQFYLSSAYNSPSASQHCFGVFWLGRGMFGECRTPKLSRKCPLGGHWGVPVAAAGRGSLEEQSPVSPRTPKWGAQRGGSAAIGGTLNSLERGRGDSPEHQRGGTIPRNCWEAFSG